MCVCPPGGRRMRQPGREGTKALENGQYEEALEQFQKASESEDKEKAAEGFRGQGIAYYEMEDYTSALDAFQKAVDNGAEQTVQLYNLMGICGMQMEIMKELWNLSRPDLP